MISNEQRLEVFKTIQENVADLYGSSELATKLRILGELYPTKNQSLFVDIIGDTILGFYHTKDLPTLLQKELGVSADTAQKIVADLAEIFAPVLEREASDVRKKQEDLRGLQQQFMSGTSDVAATPASTETAIDTPIPVAVPEEETGSIHDVAPMRTMAGDMNRIHGYGAYRGTGDTTENVVSSPSQNDLLTERPRLAGIPKLGE